ncbi:MAG: exodeoxyribonuclease VII large subunit [Firmicutes bacterium]|nr:exodeoxyribonuclease VII large subunit [Bacillota bacterium]
MERKYLTVTALNRYLKFKFDNDTNLQSVLLKAEISNFKRHSRGHFYFTLKDDQSQISAVMFFNNTKSVTFSPKDGSKVIVEGYISIYENYGTYQVYVTHLSEDGVGDLFQAFEKLKIKLEAEGMFEDKNKKPIPSFPKSIGVITSPTGAAVRDIIHVINRRYPLVKIIIYPALVQGEQAKQSIVTQIEKANIDNLVDTLIIGRGGGSIEDLWAFNEEAVARSIFASRIPIISAVGHETDFTIADFVSDMRAPTPSAAAEIAVPEKKNILLELFSQKQKLNFVMKNMLESKLKHFNQIKTSYVFSQPKRLFETRELRFSNSIDRLFQQNPEKTLIFHQEAVLKLEQDLHNRFSTLIKTSEYQYINLIEKLELVNPLSIMKKGFSIIKKDQKIIKNITNVAINDSIDVYMSDGQLNCQILSIRKDEN